MILTPPGQPSDNLGDSLPFTTEPEGTEVRYLGAYLRVDGTAPSESHLQLIAKARRGMQVWRALSTSWLGRVRLANTFLTSRIWHGVGSPGAIDMGVILPELTTAIRTAVFGRDYAFLSLDTLAMPRRYGGLGLVIPRHMFPAMAGRDLARGLHNQDHFGPLFRACMTEMSRRIDEDQGVWLERRGFGWLKRKPGAFSPLWLRLADAAHQLDLRIDPRGMDHAQLRLLPWHTRDTDKEKVYTAQELSYLRRAGLRTWGDILDSPTEREREGTVYPAILPSAWVKQVMAASSLPPDHVRLAKFAWRTLHNKWFSFILRLDDRWSQALAIPPQVAGPAPAPRWASHKPWPTIQLPKDRLELANVPLESYSVRLGRRFLISKEMHRRKVPYRLRKLLDAPLPARAQVEETDGPVGGNDGEEVPEAATDSANLSQGLPASTIMEEADSFWANLTAATRTFKIPPRIYSSAFAAYHGSLPQIPKGSNGAQAICCQGELGSRAHQLFRCRRAQAVWKHMNLMAASWGLTPASLSERECYELFPRWRSQEADAHARSGAPSALAKTLLLAIHIHAMMPFLPKPEEGNTLAPCLAQARRIMTKFPSLLPLLPAAGGTAHANANNAPPAEIV